MSPAAPEHVVQAASALQFRAMTLIYLVLATDRFTEYDAHYFPDSRIAITRLSEPKNYGLAGPPNRTVLCAELPCSRVDPAWTASDETLKQIVLSSLEAAGLPVRAPVIEVAARRLPQAYPVYTRDYRENFDRIDKWIGTVANVVTFGRQGLFAHDNTHHALAMSYALNECLDDSGVLNTQKWREHRKAFTRHVVED
jgi:protoporphyrinogen oxidase